MSAPLRKVLSVGSVAFDTVRVHSDLEQLGDFKKHADYPYLQAGGGGANMSIATRELSRIYERETDITLCTKIGVPPSGKNQRIAEFSRENVLRELHGIIVLDAVPDVAHAIPFNNVTSYKGGRFISTMFTEATVEFMPRVVDRIQREAQSADIVFIHSRYPRLSAIAALAARKHNVPVFFDYSVENPNNSNLQHYDQLLGLCTHIVAPGEARVPGMDKDDRHELFRRLVENYGIAHVAVSNSTDPVLVHDRSNRHKGTRSEIQVTQASKVVDALGVGDLRNATAILGLLHGHDFTTAIAQGTAMATFSVGYPGRDWIADAPEFMRAHPLFANDFPQNQPAAVPVTAPGVAGPGGAGN